MLKLLDKWRKDREQLRQAHEASPYAAMPFKKFVREIKNLIQNNDGDIDFDEFFYISSNPDVAAAVNAKGFFSGYVHFCLNGKNEIRPWSTRHVTRVCGLTPSISSGLTKPVNDRPLPEYGPDLSHLAFSQDPFLLILLPNLQDNLFFAGYTAFFNDLSNIFEDFSRIVVAVVSADINPNLAKKYCDRIEVISVQEIEKFSFAPNVIFCFDSETFYIAKDVFKNLDKTIYYCQDFEAGFYPYGSQFARAEGSVAQSKNIVLSTSLLKVFLEKRKLISTPHVFVTSPKIEIIDIAPQKRKRIFFYFRPEAFNTRNMPEFIIGVIDKFCLNHPGFEIFLVGTVDTCYSRVLHGCNLSIISKLPKDKYNELIASCDVVVAFIYSAHPGVIAFQAAASGIPTITNTFENRDAKYLTEISKNIIPFDPVREDLLDCIETALAMPKGTKSFQSNLYSIHENQTFPEYVSGILHS